jgi:CubicO group peptidase (beta-lactamase class C family)
MQQVENGNIKLGDDVNDLLAKYNSQFRVESDLVGNYASWNGIPRVAASGGVTVESLATHASGFDEKLLGMASRTPFPSNSSVLEDVLQKQMPPRSNLYE